MEKSESTVQISPFGNPNPRIWFLGVIPLSNFLLGLVVLIFLCTNLDKKLLSITHIKSV